MLLEPKFVFNRAMALMRRPECLDQIEDWVNRFYEFDVISENERDRMLTECAEKRPRVTEFWNKNFPDNHKMDVSVRLARDSWWAGQLSELKRVK